MNTWTDFMQQQAVGPRTDLASIWQDLQQSGFFCQLGEDGIDGGLLALHGEEAADFLHKQLTNDVLHLAPGEVRLAGYCSVKGRLLASFTIWRNPSGEIVLQMPRDMLPAVQKRLQMFVLRAKVKLQDISAQHIVLGLGGAAATQLLATWFTPASLQPLQMSSATPGGQLLRMHDSFGQARYQWLLSQEELAEVLPALQAALPTLPSVPRQFWDWLTLHAGIPQITAATIEKFVPQMINFELIGGVNFKKGCYPGQEIVARSQYLGKLKRRMYLAHSASLLEAGMEVFSAADPDQACGMVVNAAPHPTGGWDALLELKSALLDAAPIAPAGAAQALHFLPLPYALPTDAQ